MPHIDDAVLQAYIDGCCNDARVAEIEAHLDGCEECRQRIDTARAVAERASQLLGALEPGPVHAPSFEELQARAAARSAGGTPESATDEEVDWAAMMPPPSPTVVRSWRRPALAWAATVAIAFSVGWFARSGLDLPSDLNGPAAPSFERFGADVAEAPAASAPETLAERPAESPASQPVITDELDDAAAAKRSLAAPELAPAEPDPTIAPDAAGRRQGLAANAAPGAAGEVRAAEEQVARNAPAAALQPGAVAEAITVTGESPVVEMNEREGAAFVDSEVGAGFVEVVRDDAELWLGVAPRELPDLALLRVEVGPGVLIENGIPGRAAVRLIYLARSGQEIALVQQYTGSLGATPVDQVGQSKVAAADAPARAERERVSSDEPRADRRAALDRDMVVGGTLDLPATVREPDGTVTYTWIDADGYLLSISGNLAPDVVRGLADLIR